MTVNRIVAIASSAVVIGAIVTGLYLGGSPSEQRLVRMDERRVQDLNRLANAVQVYWQQQEELPTELNQLLDGQRLKEMPVDPASGTAYRYIPQDDRFELCASFDRSTLDSERMAFWQHPAGEHCFAFEAAAIILPPGRLNAIGAVPMSP
jgi:hypothetical protein